MKIEVEIHNKQVAWLRFLGMDEERLIRDLQRIVDDRVQSLVWNLQTVEEGVCIFCRVSAWMRGHLPGCKLHQDNLPEELK